MSKLEAMAYKMQPAGHEKPASRRNYSTPSKKLVKALDDMFKKCWDDFGKITPNYGLVRLGDDPAHIITDAEKFAHELMIKIPCSVDEAHGLLLHYDFKQERNYKIMDYPAGILLSTVYNKSPDKCIVFDVEPEGFIPGMLAYKLPKDKIFINYSTMGLLAGFQAAGVMLNYGQTSSSFGANSPNLVINCGTAEAVGVNAKIGSTLLNFVDQYEFPDQRQAKNDIGFDAQGSLIINTGHTMNSRNPLDAIVINTTGLRVYDTGRRQIFHLGLYKEDCEKMPNLMNYITALRQKFEAGRTDWRKAVKAIEELGPEPGKKIRHDVEDILRRHKYDV